MTVLVFGRTGQVARELRAARSVRAMGRDEVDLSDPGACRTAILKIRPSVVINAAAYTAVDQAEEEEDLAFAVNAAAPAEMARACAELGVPLVHISTDYVFDGKGTGPWSPDDQTAPLSAYGRSKLSGEEAIRASGTTYAILRTSWVFSSHGSNFVKTMLRLTETRDALSVVADQTGGPTPAAAIASACLIIADQLIEDPTKSGTFHFSGVPDTTWAGFAEAVFDVAGREVTVTGISTEDYPTPATRPANSRMDCTQTSAVFGVDRPDWRTAIQEIVPILTGEERT